ncbi:ranBP-type and C3HC4-type zinc finger-containing protein 1 isoform X2 [Anabas testudineus]|uniref:RanBP-type and C3HC4-type zinc finger-containing protein 1 n=2 Tax=Anabas testudineus TaxID=64144 RepID=A0A7N6F651_ANATE|nr:ranBP-type and C3HC4-type zinc finger-containing protein 1 isoform X2 [Anabas testudineus]XP_026203705.1 ranBP-type and C3HC4-type zinc finger-containing protein 1 isoform X2 [Anabas testudineus]
MACKVTQSVDLKEAEKLAQSLSEALSCGDTEEAVQLCQSLAQLSVPVCVTINSRVYPQDAIRLWVEVQDAQSVFNCPVTIMVSSFMTVAQLKEKINQDYGFHPVLQRWVIGKRLAQDQETLYSHGIRQDGDRVFLYILSARAAHLTRHKHTIDQKQQLIEGIVDSMDSVQLLPRGLVADGGDEKPQHTPPQTPPPPRLSKPPPPAVPPKPQLGWSCAMCTFVNKPTRPGCEMCGGERPENYKVPDIYTPDKEEVRRIQQEKLAMLQYEQARQEEREMNYRHLLETEHQNLIPNATEVDCPICFSSLKPGDGIVLRECLHTFCRECLKGTIVTSQDAEVSCPENCDSKLLDREIQALLTEEEHQRFLELRLNIAESRSEHSFHCQTPNCRGWCIYEDEVNEFHCELCGETNCILCRAIHKDMSCKDYQDDLRIRAENDQAAQQTKQMLDNLLQNGEAMKCPRCDIIIQKKDGCDWICCLMCKTEICWVTKQARWGPNGTGDTSGGCRCRVNNQPCHPNCQNCH